MKDRAARTVARLIRFRGGSKVPVPTLVRLFDGPLLQRRYSSVLKDPRVRHEQQHLAKALGGNILQTMQQPRHIAHLLANEKSLDSNAEIEERTTFIAQRHDYF